MTDRAQLDLFPDLSRETQLNLFKNLEPYLPREIPLDIQHAAQDHIGFSLNYSKFWAQYREQTALERVENLMIDFADFCAVKEGLR
jgi:hypothetical protein